MAEGLLQSSSSTSRSGTWTRSDLEEAWTMEEGGRPLRHRQGKPYCQPAGTRMHPCVGSKAAVVAAAEEGIESRRHHHRVPEGAGQNFRVHPESPNRFCLEVEEPEPNQLERLLRTSRLHVIPVIKKPHSQTQYTGH